jgi:hypothetical protein
LLATLAAVALAATIGAAVSAAAPSRLDTAVADGQPFAPDNMNASLPHVQKAGANAVRMYLSWRGFVVPPDSATKPAGMNAANPADPHYDFAGLDLQIEKLKERGLEPILNFENAPPWAERTRGSGWDDGTNAPDPAEFGQFAKAIALRYSGSFRGLPRVRYYQAWNEPNHYRHLNPQFEVTKPPSSVGGSETVPPGSPILSIDLYRSLLNAFAASVHSVHSDNLVVAGGLSTPGRPFRQTPAVAPLVFMQTLLCLDSQNHQIPGCNAQTQFDVWAAHPYTSGSPEHHASDPNDVSIPELPRMRSTLQAANRIGSIVSTNSQQFWVTEFSWDTNPPDPGAVPMKLHERWVAEALYRSWTYGVSLFTWFQIRDEAPAPGQPFSDSFQSGLFFRCASGSISCDKPKPSLEAFRFPFVAYKHGKGKVLVWGRTPFGKRGRVTIQQKGSGFKKLIRLKTNGHGLFTKVLRTKGKGVLRARLGKENSIPFSLTVPPDRPGNPFG